MRKGKKRENIGELVQQNMTVGTKLLFKFIPFYVSISVAFAIIMLFKENDFISKYWALIFVLFMSVGIVLTSIFDRKGR